MAKKPFPPKNGSRMTEKRDDMLDRKAGIPENGARDRRIDKSRGLPADTPKKKPFGK